MRIYYPKLRNKSHALSLSIYIAFTGTIILLFSFTAAVPYSYLTVILVKKSKYSVYML